MTIVVSVSKPKELTPDELALVLEALEDAAFYRDARSHVVQTAVRRRDRRLAIASPNDSDAGASHRQKARAYQALALKLKRG